MKLSIYSLSYSREFAQGELDVFKFLSLCRQLGVEGASLHVRHLDNARPDYLKRIRRAYLDQGLSISLFTVSTNFGRAAGKPEEELTRAREAVRVAGFLGAPLVRVFAGSPASEADRPRAFDHAAA